jgi:dihydropteroate synthase
MSSPRTRTARALVLRDGRRIGFPAVMGVLNVTPDSFSDGGQFLDPERALDHALAMEAEGAAIIDVGGESTRPRGASSISVEEERARVEPVLRLLGRRTRAPISIDTRKAAIAQLALDLGAALINDVSAFEHDSAMAPLAARTGCAVVLMHMRGSPENHMKFARYRDVVAEVVHYLKRRAEAVSASGVARRRIVLDPGLGFAKTARHNLQLLGGLSRLTALGYPILVGASRKSFVRKCAGEEPDSIRAGNAVVNAVAILGGTAIVRVHEVAQAIAAVRMAEAVRQRRI